MEKGKVPEIRFKGFTDDWKQYQLSHIAKRVIRKNTGLQSTLLLTISAQYGLIGQITYFNCRVAGINIRNYYLLKKGEFAYNKSSSEGFPYGAIKRLDLYENGVLSGLYIVFALKDVNKINSDFIVSYYDTEKWQKDISEVAAEGARNHGLLNISVDNFMKTKLMIPHINKEQQLIGNYFKSFDNLITLHQRRYEKLKFFKKAMIKKMFPKNGEKVPEIRFKGFTDNWEQHKLKDIANKVIQKNRDLSVLETFTNSAEYGVVSQRDFFEYDVSNIENISGYFIVGKDNFVYNPRISAIAPVGPINRNKLGRKGIVSPSYTVFQVHNIDYTFLEYFFKGNAWHSYMYFNGDNGARTDRFSIKNEVFFDMPILYPQIEEQRMIGRYLERLDNLIILHQSKYEKLKLFKAAMLEKMFV